MTEHDAVNALERLGLSNYEARVFLALQRLGTGTAREIHDVAGVPRSQVYGVTESLETRGLVEIQQGTPKRYRPVSPDTARRLLSEEIEMEADRAFSYLEEVHCDQATEETRQDVWVVHGRESITDRVVGLLDRATERVIFGAARPAFVSDALVDALEDLAAGGVDVLVTSVDPDVLDRFPASCETRRPPADAPGDFTGRVLIVDDDVILLSVLDPNDDEETAIWSADTAMARVLVQTTAEGIRALIDA